MSESQNTKVEKDGKTSKGAKEVKQVIPAKTPEPSKSDRLDRMEEKLQLIEDGLLVLIHSTQWHNLSINPVGAHNPNHLIDGFDSLKDAIYELSPANDEQVAQ